LKKSGAVGLSLALALLFARGAAAATLTVNAGGSLQAAIDAAQPGDTILVDPSGVFNGPIKLRAKGGTADITIRSAAPDASLPPPGTRIDPLVYAKFLPKIRANNTGPALKTEPGATHYVLMFLEFLPASSTASANLVELGGAGSSQSNLSVVPHHLVIDRCYLHGDASYGQRRGIALNSGDTKILNSYFKDFKGVNQDTQAIMGWNGPGPFVIENNYLEAAGENIMFGGTDPNIPNLIPNDIKILRNLITKPTAWMTQAWTVKNLVEFKNAQNVLVEGNTIENNWAAGQQGYSILFTPRNQSGTAPWTTVRDVTIQNNVIRHVAAVFNICGYDNLATSEQTQNIIIRNNLIYDVAKAWAKAGTTANGRLAVIGGGPKNITFDHNTVDNTNGNATIFIYAGFSRTGTSITGFEATNNLFSDTSYGIYGDKYGEGIAGLNAYTPNALVLKNALAGGVAKLYPTGNDFPTQAAWLADFVNPSASDYRLKSTSLSKNFGTDGRDLGVDFSELNNALTTTPPTPAPAPAPTPTPTPAPAPTPAPSPTSPYSGTPVALPGTVQFENYDTGGNDVAYHDTTSGNTGAVYRSNNVDIQATTDAGGGYNIGWVKATEWLTYTVSVATAGTYAVDVRVASNGAGGTLHFEVDGVNVTGPIAVPNTGGWQAWKTITKTGVTLPAGQHVVRVVMDANGATGSIANLNWFAIR
jgi:carbohydrate binding protein with CBM6 domain